MKRTLLATLLFVAPALAASPAWALDADDWEAPAAEAAQAPSADASDTAAPDADDPDALPSLDDLLAKKAQDTAATWSGPGPAPKRGYPWFEHHGYFRLRLDGFYRAHLGTNVHADGRTVNSSSFAPPLSTNVVNKPRGEDWIGGANMRFRYAPTVHVSPALSVTAEFDVLDNLMLGSTPDFDPDRPDAPFAALSRSQQPTSGNRFSGKDAVSVKQAYATWAPFRPNDTRKFLLEFSGGRMARHWGLGILENDGQDLDADFGTYVDRVNLLTRLWGVYVELGYGWVASGPSSATSVQPYGEPYDLTNQDDVTDIALAIFQKPRTDAERQARFNRLVVRNKPALDWGVYLVYRSQKMDIVDTLDGSWYPSQVGKYDTLTLESRSAWMLTPDLWLKLEWKPSAKEHVRIEFEAAAVFGRIDRVPRYSWGGTAQGWQRDGDAPLDILSYGMAIEGEYTRGPISTGLHAGLASGTDTPYFGYRDQSNFLFDRRVTKLKSFYFNPDYKVDQLLFRYGLGTVTDAVYIKPFVQYDLFEGDRDALAGRLELMYARALQSEATPGNNPNLGVEIDVKLFYEEKGVFFAGFDWGILFPLKGMNVTADYGCAPGANGQPTQCHNARSARWAMSVKGRFGVMF